jgi:pyrroloquinoline quinone biosynthesis protein D
MAQALRMASRSLIEAGSKPAFPRHVKFHFNKQREQWVILAPERLLVPDETSVEILQLCDGAATVETIVGKLVEKYNAPADVIMKDVIRMLQDLADKGFLVA